MVALQNGPFRPPVPACNLLECITLVAARPLDRPRRHGDIVRLVSWLYVQRKCRRRVELFGDRFLVGFHHFSRRGKRFGTMRPLLRTLLICLTSSSVCSGRASVQKSRSSPSRPSSASRTEPPTRCNSCPAAANRRPSSSATGDTRISSATARRWAAVSSRLAAGGVEVSDIGAPAYRGPRQHRARVSPPAAHRPATPRRRRAPCAARRAPCVRRPAPRRPTAGERASILQLWWVQITRTMTAAQPQLQDRRTRAGARRRSCSCGLLFREVTSAFAVGHECKIGAGRRRAKPSAVRA